MIPDIGILIAAYVTTRCVQIFSEPLGIGQRWIEILTRVFAAITIVVAFVVGLDLLLRGSTTQALPNFPR